MATSRCVLRNRSFVITTKACSGIEQKKKLSLYAKTQVAQVPSPRGSVLFVLCYGGMQQTWPHHGCGASAPTTPSVHMLQLPPCICYNSLHAYATTPSMHMLQLPPYICYNSLHNSLHAHATTPSMHMPQLPLCICCSCLHIEAKFFFSAMKACKKLTCISYDSLHASATAAFAERL